MTHNDYIVETKRRVVHIIELMIKDEIEILEGIRELINKLKELSFKNDNDYLFLKGIESETDEFPLMEQRTNYDKEYLLKLDFEKKEYLKPLEKEIKITLQNIQNKL